MDKSVEMALTHFLVVFIVNTMISTSGLFLEEEDISHESNGGMLSVICKI